jgi:outer membrane lipoprotein-sorting protein
LTRTPLRTFTVTLSFALTFACVAISASAQSADEIVSKALTARGGLEKIKAVQSQRISGTISFGPGAEGPFVVELKRPLKMHMEITIQGQTITRVYNGKGEGWVINPFGENKEVQSMSTEDIKNIADESDFDGPLVDYKEKGHQIELIGKEQVQIAGKEQAETKPAWRLKLMRKGGDVRYYLFDADTFTLLKWEGKRKAEDKEYTVESFFRDYRDINGLKFAFEIDSDSPGSEQQQKILIEKLELDPKFEEARFAKPSAPPASATKPSED